MGLAPRGTSMTIVAKEREINGDMKGRNASSLSQFSDTRFGRRGLQGEQSCSRWRAAGEITASGDNTSRCWTFDAYSCWNRVHSARRGALLKNYRGSIRIPITRPPKPIAVLASFSSLTSQTSGGKHLTRGARLERLRQTSPRAGLPRDLEQLARETADAPALSDTRLAAIAFTISSSAQHMCAIRCGRRVALARDVRPADGCAREVGWVAG
jgi:hypothetical protein